MDVKTLVLLSLFLSAFPWENVGVVASDTELASDLDVPAGAGGSNLEGNFFTSTLLRNVLANFLANAGDFAMATPANVLTLEVFPALQGLGVSSALFNYPPGAVNVPHTHPRGTEILYIIEGTLDVGLIDSTNSLVTQTLVEGDIFIFPKGLVHFQINWGKDSKSVRALAGFSTSDPGLVRLPNTLFKTGISDEILSDSFGVSPEVIKQLKVEKIN